MLPVAVSVAVIIYTCTLLQPLFTIMSHSIAVIAVSATTQSLSSLLSSLMSSLLLSVWWWWWCLDEVFVVGFSNIAAD